jgi:predicted HicB family RNase H-like nuclease
MCFTMLPIIGWRNPCAPFMLKFDLFHGLFLCLTDVLQFYSAMVKSIQTPHFHPKVNQIMSDKLWT